MATPILASESPSGEGTLNVDSKCLDTSFSFFFFINFCNICSFRSNFQSVEHHFSTKPHLFLTETQVSKATNKISILGDFMFTTNFGFPLPSLTILVN
ncbi:hypothetical protein E2C01_066895 [Portunus trituberculatus]|uniref:Uncharacterized protein n=1 Tax=Portunus trituberculatus TaxID=210409 RepID=A0A5B7HR34_PORTR|nr:hypothetical protein [Portunus trituberculatus]